MEYNFILKTVDDVKAYSINNSYEFIRKQLVYLNKATAYEYYMDIEDKDLRITFLEQCFKINIVG